MHQKRVSDLITDGCEPPCGCWDLNSGPSEEQSMLLTTEPSLQPWISFLLFFYFLVFQDRVSLYSSGCLGTHFVDQAGLELRNPPASASRPADLAGKKPWVWSQCHMKQPWWHRSVTEYLRGGCRSFRSSRPTSATWACFKRKVKIRYCFLCLVYTPKSWKEVSKRGFSTGIRNCINHNRWDMEEIQPSIIRWTEKQNSHRALLFSSSQTPYAIHSDLEHLILLPPLLKCGVNDWEIKPGSLNARQIF